MNNKQILWVSVSLIVLSLIGMFYSFNMQVTLYSGDDIVNIHLLSQQQNILIFSGIAFISGIILFALHHSSKKDENDISQAAGDSNSNADNISYFSELKRNSIDVIKKTSSDFNDVIKKISPDFSYMRDPILKQLTIALLVVACGLALYHFSH